MEKINFVNDSEPYLSAENLNQMQSNIEDETKIEEIELITMNEGFSMVGSQKFFKQGRHIWGDVIIKKDDGAFTNAYSYPVTLKYAIPYGYNTFCILTNGQFGADKIAYMYVSGNNASSLLIADASNSGNNHAKIHLDYVINE